MVCRRILGPPWLFLPLCVSTLLCFLSGCSNPELHLPAVPRKAALAFDKRVPAATKAVAEPEQANDREGIAYPEPEGKRPLFARARRCGECHEKMRNEWQVSAHARSTHSVAYVRAILSLPLPVRGECAACHLPGLPYGQDADAPGRRSEGVSCDGCHTVSAVTVDEVRARPTYSPDNGKRYGPILGASGHYFHDMAYSELHKKSEICAGCHHLMAFTFGGETRNIPVVTDYAGWKRYGHDRSCQDCHMPSDGPAPVARGSRARPDVPSHSFAGAATLGKQFRLEVSVDPREGQLTVEMAHAAGHLVPSGYVDRRLIVRATFYDQAGGIISYQDHAYGVFLEDDQGRPAPFFRATRVKEDRRMLPGRTYSALFKIPDSGDKASGQVASRVIVAILAARTAPELSAVYGEPDLLVLKSAAHSLVGGGSKSQGG